MALHRILMVEDEPDIQTVARLALETVGEFTVATCDAGEQALARAPAFRPDLILLDVNDAGHGRTDHAQSVAAHTGTFHRSDRI